MSRRLVYLAACDICHVEGEEGGVVKVGIPISFGPVAKEIDLCGECKAKVFLSIEPFLTAARKPAAEVKAKAKNVVEIVPVPEDNAPGTVFPCPECGRQCQRKQGLGAHRRKAHGIIGEHSKAAS